MYKTNYYEFNNIPSHIDWGYINVYDNDYLGNSINLNGDHEGETVYDIYLQSTPSTITGQVLDSETLIPVDDVVVCFTTEDSLSYDFGQWCHWTDNGQYNFDVPNGCHTLYAYQENYIIAMD